jgi:hypothetical protein
VKLLIVATEKIREIRNKVSVECYTLPEKEPGHVCQQQRTPGRVCLQKHVLHLECLSTAACAALEVVWSPTTCAIPGLDLQQPVQRAALAVSIAACTVCSPSRVYSSLYSVQLWPCPSTAACAVRSPGCVRLQQPVHCVQCAALAVSVLQQTVQSAALAVVCSKAACAVRSPGRVPVLQLPVQCAALAVPVLQQPVQCAALAVPVLQQPV